jgi:hypothetical protein
LGFTDCSSHVCSSVMDFDKLAAILDPASSSEHAAVLHNMDSKAWLEWQQVL